MGKGKRNRNQRRTRTKAERKMINKGISQQKERMQNAINYAIHNPSMVMTNIDEITWDAELYWHNVEMSTECGDSRAIIFDDNMGEETYIKDIACGYFVHSHYDENDELHYRVDVFGDPDGIDYKTALESLANVINVNDDYGYKYEIKETSVNDDIQKITE